MTTQADPLQPIYDEFGKEETHRMRRQLTADKGAMPSYIELYAALALQAAPRHKPPAMGRPRKEVEQ